MTKHTMRSEGSASPPTTPTLSDHSDPPTGARTGLREADGSVILAVRVSPRASRDALTVEGGRLRVWLHAPPVKAPPTPRWSPCWRIACACPQRDHDHPWRQRAQQADRHQRTQRRRGVAAAGGGVMAVSIPDAM